MRICPDCGAVSNTHIERYCTSCHHDWRAKVCAEHAAWFEQGNALLPMITNDGELVCLSVVPQDNVYSIFRHPVRNVNPSITTIQHAYEYYKKAAECGDAVYNYAAAAAFIESKWLDNGILRTRPHNSMDECMPYLYRAVEGGIVEAIHLYCSLIYVGNAVQLPSASKGFADYLYKAAGAGYADSECLLGLQLLESAFRPRNELQASDWLNKAITHGCWEAKAILGMMCFSEGKITEAWTYFQESSSLPLSNYMMGLMHQGGYVPGSSKGTALFYFAKIEDLYKDNGVYCRNVAQCHILGQDTSCNRRDGLRWLEQAKNCGENVSKLERLCQADNPSLANSEGEDGVLTSGNFSIEEALADIVGQDGAKDAIERLYKSLKSDARRFELLGESTWSRPLCFVFSGSPKTGKRKFAAIVAKMLCDLEVLQSDSCFEAGRAELVSSAIGGTASQTRAVCESALGGLLYIENPVTLLGKSEKDYGPEALDELLNFIEDHQGQLAVVLAGTQSDNELFFRNAATGFSSLFPQELRITFSDYTDDQLILMVRRQLKDHGWQTPNSTIEAIPSSFLKYVSQEGQAGNIQTVGNYIAAVEQRQGVRSFEEELVGGDLITLIPDDLEVVVPNQAIQSFNIEEEFAGLIGMKAIKEQLLRLEASIKMEQFYQDRGIAGDKIVVPHMVFVGSPGTGKTTVARLLARMLAHLGVIGSAKVVETKREDLVAGYIGQTGPKAMAKYQEALGGVLFVDEAYRLGLGGENDFGREAAEALMQFAEDNRGRVVIILAGYEQEIEEFFERINPGMKSRFSNIIRFPDFTPEELVKICCINCMPSVPTEQAHKKMLRIFEEACKEKNFGNGRYAREVANRANENKKLRQFTLIESGQEIQDEALLVIEEEDIQAV